AESLGPLRCVRTFPPIRSVYTRSLHDALPIFHYCQHLASVWLLHNFSFSDSHQPNIPVTLTGGCPRRTSSYVTNGKVIKVFVVRSEEHTSELQSREKLVCRLLLEKKTTTTGWL